MNTEHNDGTPRRMGVLGTLALASIAALASGMSLYYIKEQERSVKTVRSAVCTTPPHRNYWTQTITYTDGSSVQLRHYEDRVFGELERKLSSALDHERTSVVPMDVWEVDGHNHPRKLIKAPYCESDGYP